MWGNQIEDMDTSDTPWYWYYMADCGRWHRFEDGPDNQLRSEFIEEYYRKNSQGVLTKVSSDCPSKIDFSVMLHTDFETGKQTRIQRGFNIERSCSCFSASPDFWENVDPTCPFQLIPLSGFTPEYKTVAHYVKTEGLLDRSILSIKRIQNADLWELFCRKRKQLMRIHGVKEIEERRLFHGTKTSNVETICKYNFDLGLIGQNGHALGKGIYFAKYATYADRYSKSNRGESTKIMFLARVMIGTSIPGQRDFQKPDHGQAENVHNSCVDNVQNPTIFVIFNPNQIYPEYLIEYK